MEEGGCLTKYSDVLGLQIWDNSSEWDNMQMLLSNYSIKSTKANVGQDSLQPSKDYPITIDYYCDFWEVWIQVVIEHTKAYFARYRIPDI